VDDARRLEQAIDADYLRRIVDRLEGFRSHPLGFRVAGTPEERAATAFVAQEMLELGLVDVVEEPVPVDAWRLTNAFVEAGGRRFECASFGGVPETGRPGIEAELVVAGRSGRRELEGLDVEGRIVLVDWVEDGLWPYHVALELGLRGALALVVAPGEGGPYYQSPGALGTFDGIWHRGAPTAVTVRREDAVALRAREGSRVRVVLEAPLTRGAEAANVVGVIPGRVKGAPIVMAGHHDGWFGGAFDDATGVAATLAVAKAYAETGIEPRRSLAFVSHTAEEYGIAESRYDWCYGAWYQVAVEHPEWGAGAPFYLNVEGSGSPGDPLTVDAPPELAGWCERVCRHAERDGLLPHGWALDEPSTWTEVWTFLAAGIPGLNVSTFTTEYNRTDYHTQYDTTSSVDFEYLARLTRICARFVAEADADLDRLLDYGARAEHLRAGLGPHRMDGLERLPELRGREAFTAVGRGLHGLDAWERAAYPHVQTAADVERLERALPLLHGGRWANAADELAGVGVNRLAADLSQEAFARERARVASGEAWGGQGDPDPGPDLWAELASLRGEAGADETGPWVARSVERHLEESRRELERRLERMSAAVRESAQWPRA
jgi:Iap family predicted aminopeptidase